MTTEELPDVEFLQKPSLWPYYPACPIKRQSGSPMPECAVIFNVKGNETTVILANMFEIPSMSFREIYDKYPVKKYDSFQAIIDDGWECD